MVVIIGFCKFKHAKLLIFAKELLCFLFLSFLSFLKNKSLNSISVINLQFREGSACV